MDAFARLLCLLLMVTAIILSDTIIGYLIDILLLAAVIHGSQIGWRKACGGIRHLWLFFVLILCMNAWFFESEEVWLSWWIFRLSPEGILQGLQVIIRVMLIMVYGTIFTAMTTPLEINGAFRTLLYPLKYIGVPVQDVAMILGAAIQFIPVFTEEAAMIKKAQTARGALFESKKLRERGASFLPLIIPMFLAAFRRADELALAMEARGYRKGYGGSRKRRVLTMKDWGAIGFCGLIVIMIILV